MNIKQAVILVATRLLFITLMPEDCKALDLGAWEEVANQLGRGENPYATTAYLSWPPLWIQLIYWFDRTALLLDVRFDWVVRFFLIAIDLVLATSIYILVSRKVRIQTARNVTLFGFVLNPVPFLLTVQHANFDGLVALWILAALYLLVVYFKTWDPTPWLASCLMVGLGILTKTIPILLAPMVWTVPLLRSRQSLKSRAPIPLPWGSLLLGLVLIFGPSAITVGTLYVLDPITIVTKVINYRSVIHFGFGFPWIMARVGLSDQIDSYKSLFSLTMAAMGLFSIYYLYRMSYPPDFAVIVKPAIALLASVTALGPGHGPQYIFWFFPLLVVLYPLADRPMRWAAMAFFVISAITYVLEYGFIPYLGASILRFFPHLQTVTRFLMRSNQGIARIPIFLAYLALLIALFRSMRLDLKEARSASI